jgi:hypothetical protein
MLSLEDWGTIFLLASIAGALVIGSPALALVLPSQAGEKFSPLYILGPNRMAKDYPFNVKAGENYNVYLGIGNHMGSSAYYALYVKIRSQTEPLPNSTDGTPSPLSALYEYRILLRDGEVWEAPFNFSLSNFFFSGNSCSIYYFSINGETLNVSKIALWDSGNKGFFFEVFFELWVYNKTVNDFRYHERFVSLRLNATI